MPQEPSLSTQYRRVLTKILAASQKYSHLWDHIEYIPGALPLVSCWTCEQDNDAVYYGITKDEKGRLVFCYADGKIENPLEDSKGTPISVTMFIKKLENRNVPVGNLKRHFLESIAEPIKIYELLNAGINEKVRRKLKNLEKMLG
jgi:hypothetical protein